MMSVMDPLNLVLLVVAAIVAWRLWGVLGTRTGFEKPPIVLKPISEKPKAEIQDRTVQGETLQPDVKKPVWFGYADENSELAKGLESVASRTPDFAPDGFIRGANAAYEIILEAFAKSNKQTLKPLLSKELFENFASAIDDREAKGQNMTFQFVGVKNAVLRRAELNGSRVQLDVDFTAEMISATLDMAATVIEGDAKSIRTVADLWTFERDVTSKDPNWKLVATDDNV